MSLSTKKRGKKEKEKPIFLFLSDLPLQRFQEVITKETDNLAKNPHQYSVLLIMNHHSSNFRGEES